MTHTGGDIIPMTYTGGDMTHMGGDMSPMSHTGGDVISNEKFFNHFVPLSCAGRNCTFM